MTLTLREYLQQLFSNLPLCLTTVLTLGVILVNGWTDAPNAIATCVSTRSMKAGSAIIMAAFFNFFGVLFMTLVNATVAETIFHMVDFGNNSKDAITALCASLFAIVLWATAAWAFGIPTSESHALIAGLSGSAIAIHGGLNGINANDWIRVIYGLLLSTFAGFAAGFFITRLVETLCQNLNRRKANQFFGKAQIAGAACTAFMHGAQDGQKFMGVFLLGIFLAKGNSNITEFQIPIWLMLLCSIVMALGTSIGGYRIIKSVGMGMVKLEKYQGFCADLAASIAMLVSSFSGMPVSTTHTKTTAIMGVGASKRLSSVNWATVREMCSAWLLTFPGCGLIGFIMAQIFIKLF